MRSSRTSSISEMPESRASCSSDRRARASSSLFLTGKGRLSNAVAGPLPVLAHCGAQTTADTVELAAHAAEAGAEAVAVIAPPYFQFDEDELLAHFAAAARACAPLPFYVYEFEKVSGYPIPVSVVERLRETVDNLAGMKVSDAPFAKVSPYLLDGLDVYIGAEALIGEGLAAGAAGAVSGLAAAFPEVVVEAVRTGDSTAAGELRAIVDRYPRLPALKAVVRSRGRADARGRARPAARADRRRAATSCYSPWSRSSSIASPGAGVHVGAALVDALGSRSGLRLRVRLLGRGELRLQLVRGIRRGRRGPRAPPEDRPQAQTHRPTGRSSASRPRCYTAAASRHARRAVTRSGAREVGPIQSMRRENSGL